MSPRKVSWLFIARFLRLNTTRRGAKGRRFVREPSVFDLAYKNDMTSTFATQFISGSPKATCEHKGKEGLLTKGSIAYIKGLQRKENINGPPGCIRILIMRIKKVLRRHVCREKKKRAETGSSGLARKSTSEVSCPFPSEMGYHNPIFENSVFITRSPLVYPDMVCSVSEYKILIE